jgi:hypothetical protein
MSRGVFRLCRISTAAWVSNLSLVCILLLNASYTTAQVSQTHRFEREQKNFSEYYTIVSLKEEGMALLR